MKKRILYCVIVILVSPRIHANDNLQQISVGKYIFPSLLSEQFLQGLTIPVYLKFDGDSLLHNVKSQQKVANALIVYKSEKLFVENIMFDDVVQNTQISQDVRKKLESIKQEFDNNMNLKVTDSAFLQFDLQSLYLELTVNKDALGTTFIQRSDMLGESTSNGISSILNYRFGTAYNEFNNYNSSSSYLNLDSISSIREHHVSLSGSLYGLGDAKTHSDLYRALYERDFEGNRLAVGLMDTWSMQSIANISALNASRLYAASYGNRSNTVINDKKQSLIPIVVFMPSAGTVQIYRDDRLLSIQNFSMGSHEIDTSALPYGFYNVELKTVINGEEISSTISQVNKSFGSSSSVTDVLDWQVFAGMLEYLPQYNSLRDRQREKETWTAGLALAKNFAALSGVGVRSTFYAFDENAVAEFESNIVFPSNTSLNIQTMYATDGSYLAAIALNYNLANGLGGVWGARRLSEVGDKLYFIETDSYDAGISLNLKQLNKNLGLLSSSYSKNLRQVNSNFNLEYQQNILSTRIADVGLRAGLQNSKYTTQNIQDKYIYFDIRLPISKWFSAGLSSKNSNLLANVSYRQNFQDGVITSVGAEVSQVVYNKNNDINNDDFKVSGYLAYENKFNNGILSASGSSNNYSLNYTSQGSVAATTKHIVLGNNNLNSGVIIETGLMNNEKMSALINGQDYTLSGKKNYIPLVPFKEYTIELMNDKKSINTISIGQGRKSTIVLYPGNISVIKPDIKQMVTIFGRALYPDGEVAANSNIHNHIGKSITDENGEFSMDVDKRYPIITLIEENGDICESTLNLTHLRGAAWLGDIHCVYKPVSRQKDILGGIIYD